MRLAGKISAFAHHEQHDVGLIRRRQLPRQIRSYCRSRSSARPVRIKHFDLVAGRFANRGQRRAAVGWPAVERPGAELCLRGIGQRPNDGQLLYLGPIERQEPVIVLQHHDRLPGELASNTKVILGQQSEGCELIGIWAFKQSKLHLHAKHVRNKLVDRRFRNLAILDKSGQMIVIGVTDHFHIHAGTYCRAARRPRSSRQ